MRQLSAVALGLFAMLFSVAFPATSPPDVDDIIAALQDAPVYVADGTEGTTSDTAAVLMEQLRDNDNVVLVLLPEDQAPTTEEINALTEQISDGLGDDQIVGDGQNDHDAKIHKTVWPDQQVNYDRGSEVAHYVPCGPRNFIVTNGGESGDWASPIEAVTADNTPVLVTIDALWQLNQTEDVLLKFAELCNKYNCYSTEAVAGQNNNATDGWVDMLEENFLPAIDDAVKVAMTQIPDDIWEKQDQSLKDQMQELTSEAFMDEISQRTGYNVDLFCGSGNSAWSDPLNAGEKGNTFTCSNVRFDHASVEARDQETQDNATAQNQVELDTQANQARYDKSYPLYGEQTHFWLGVQDAVSKCPAGSTCNIYLGNVPQQ